MQIVTLEDEIFPEILAAWRNSTLVGKYWKSPEGDPIIVCITNQFVLIAQESVVTPPAFPRKIAVRAARSIEDAETIAHRVLTRERGRGSFVEIFER